MNNGYKKTPDFNKTSILVTSAASLDSNAEFIFRVCYSFSTVLLKETPKRRLATQDPCR